MEKNKSKDKMTPPIFRFLKEFESELKKEPPFTERAHKVSKESLWLYKKALGFT
jgi:hypothetical protein